MTNVIHPKLDHDIVEDFEEEDDDPIAALPFKMGQVNLSIFLFKVFNVRILVKAGITHRLFKCINHL
jgi:hypothetical protein